MIEIVECWIQLKPYPVERLWVHLNPSSSQDREPFCIRVPLRQAEASFDPDAERDESETLSDHLARLFGEHGSFMVDGMLKECRKLNGVQKQPFNFIIVSIDAVTSNDSWLTITGSVIPSSRNRRSND